MLQKDPVILRGLTVLSKIVDHSGNASCATIARELGLAKTTVHRILQQLVDSNYLQKHTRKKQFVLTNKVYELAHNILASDSYYAPRHQILKNLSEQTNETCNFSILEGFEIVYYDRVECNWPIRIQLPIGSKLPLYCTASGKLFLAYMPSKARRQYFESVKLTAHSENTITDIELLEKELKLIHSQKFACDNQEFIPGMVAISAPVFREKNTIDFSVAIHAPAIRSSLEDLKKLLPTLQEATDNMSKLI